MTERIDITAAREEIDARVASGALTTAEGQQLTEQAWRAWERQEFLARTLIRYDDGTEEWLTDSEPGMAPLPERGYMPKASLCASHGGFTVVAREVS